MKQTEDRANEIEEPFALSDEDGDGQINLTEFRGLMLALDRGMHDIAVGDSFLAIDTNRDGRISVADFRSWWLRG
jgi:Ca2+-binding EF-hand superfamily protein